MNFFLIAILVLCFHVNEAQVLRLMSEILNGAGKTAKVAGKVGKFAKVGGRLGQVAGAIGESGKAASKAIKPYKKFFNKLKKELENHGFETDRARGEECWHDELTQQEMDALCGGNMVCTRPGYDPYPGVHDGSFQELWYHACDEIEKCGTRVFHADIDVCNDWCNTDGKFGCSVSTIPKSNPLTCWGDWPMRSCEAYTCDCSECNGCPEKIHLANAHIDFVPWDRDEMAHEIAVNERLRETNQKLLQALEELSESN